MGIGSCIDRLLKSVNRAMVYPMRPWFPVTPLDAPRNQSIKGLLMENSEFKLRLLASTDSPQVENGGASEQGREHAGYHIQGS